MHSIGVVLSALSAAILILFGMHCSRDNNWQAPWKRLCAFFLVALAMASFIPDKNEVYVILGIHAVTSDADAKDLPSNLTKAANSWLKKQQ